MWGCGIDERIDEAFIDAADRSMGFGITAITSYAFRSGIGKAALRLAN